MYKSEKKFIYMVHLPNGNVFPFSFCMVPVAVNRSSFFFIGNNSLVAVDYSCVPLALRADACGECDDPEVQQAINDLIKDFEADSIFPPVTSISPEPQSPGREAVATETQDNQETCNPLDDTDEDIWAGKRTKAKKEIDLEASTKLVEAVKENWNDVMNKNISRSIVFGKIAVAVREKGVRITRNPSNAWKLVYYKWRKLKETFCTFVDSSSQTGNGACKPPPLYEELHELLGWFTTL